MYVCMCIYIYICMYVCVRNDSYTTFIYREREMHNLYIVHVCDTQEMLHGMFREILVNMYIHHNYGDHMVHSVPERFGPCIYLVLYNVYILYRSVCVWDNITIQEKTDKQYSIVIRILSYNMFFSIWYVL